MPGNQVSKTEQVILNIDYFISDLTVKVLSENEKNYLKFYMSKTLQN